LVFWGGSAAPSAVPGIGITQPGSLRAEPILRTPGCPQGRGKGGQNPPNFLSRSPKKKEEKNIKIHPTYPEAALFSNASFLVRLL